MGCHHQHTAGLSTELVAGFLRYGPVSTFELELAFFFSLSPFFLLLGCPFSRLPIFFKFRKGRRKKERGKRIDGEFLGKVEQEREKKKIPSFLLTVFFPSFHLISPYLSLGEGEGSDIALP